MGDKNYVRSAMRRLMILLLPLVCTYASAQSPSLAGKECKNPPTIDGTINEAEWAEASTWTKFVESQNGSEPTEQTQIWLSYDRNFIYFAARAIEPKDLIRANEYRFNSSLSGDDHVTLLVDFSGTMSDFNSFSMNPRGGTSLSLAGGRAIKREWLGEFVSKGSITDKGYEVEAKIPWSIMKVGSKGRKNLRFNVERFLSHNNRTHAMAFTNDNHITNTPTWVDVDVPGEKVPTTLKLLPYAYGGWDKESGRISDAGVDFKTPISEKVEFVGSVNPDFKNLENSILSLDFSRFERLSSEVRPFFLEGGDYLNTGIFASQRISKFSAGVKTYGKLNDQTSFGILDTWSPEEKNRVLVTTTNTTPNDQFRFSYAGTDRNGINNETGLLRYSGNRGPFSIFVREMMSKDTIRGIGKDYNLNLGWSKNPWSFNGTYQYSQPDTIARLGFVPEVDLKGPSFNFSHDAQPSSGRAQSYGFGGGTTDLEHLDGSFYRTERYAFGYINDKPTKLSANINLDAADFEGQKDTTYSLALSYPYSNRYRNAFVNWNQGTAATDPYRSIGFGGRYRTLQNKLDVSLNSQLVDYQGFSDQYILSASYDLGNDRSVSARIVKSGPDIGPYVAFKKSGNKGAEYFLLIGNPNSAQFRTAITLKVTMPIEVLLKR